MNVCVHFAMYSSAFYGQKNRKALNKYKSVLVLSAVCPALQLQSTDILVSGATHFIVMVVYVVMYWLQLITFSFHIELMMGFIL